MRIRFRGFATSSAVAMSVALAGGAALSASVPRWGQPAGEPPTWTPNPNWDAPSAPTLTITVDEIMPGGRRFAPLGVEFRIRVSGSLVGDTPDTAAGTQRGSDGAVSGPSTFLQPIEWLNAFGFQSIDPTFQRIQYVVHTGDSGDYRSADRLAHPSHASKAFQYGQNPGHVYSNPGTYTNRSIYVYDDQGAWGRLDLEDRVVENPDTVFAPNYTIVVSNEPGETWSGAPPHDPANRFTTFTAALDRYHQLINLTPLGDGVRISVKPGTTYNEYANTLGVGTSNTRAMDPSSRGRSLVDTWGGVGIATYDESNVATGGRRGFIQTGSHFGIVWKNVKVDLGYDVFAGMPKGGWQNRGTENFLVGDHGRFPVFAGSAIHDALRGQRHIFDNCEFRGVGGAVFTLLGPGNPVEYTSATGNWVARYSCYFWNDCIGEELNDYWCYQAANYFMTGNQILETYGAELGAGGRNRFPGYQRGFRGHRGIRETTAWVQYQRANYLESRGGWGGGADSSLGGQAGTAFANQPMLRLYETSNPFLRYGKRIYVCDSVIQGGFGIDGNETSLFNGYGGVHAVVENNLMIFNPMAQNAAHISDLSGLKGLRNNQFLLLDTFQFITNTNPRPATLVGKDLSRFEGGIRFGEFDRFFAFSTFERTRGQPFESLHNTFVALRPDAQLRTQPLQIRSVNTGGSSGSGTVSEPVTTVYSVVEGHNIVYAPNLASPQGPAMTKLDLPEGIRVLDVWMKLVWERAQFTLPSSVAPTGLTPPIPYPVDWYGNPTTGASYAGSARANTLRIGANGTIYQEFDLANAGYVWPRHIEVIHDLDASGNPAAVAGTGTHFRVRNTHPTATWPAGVITVGMHRGTTAMEPDLLIDIDQSDVALYVPTDPQPLTEGVRSTLFDFGRSLRPSSGFAIAPAGTNSAGAMLPAAPSSPALAPTTMVTSVTDPLTGHIYNFSEPVQAGQYWNGEWFVVESETATITSVTPIGTTSGRIMNGLVKDPYRGGGTSAQGFDSSTSLSPARGPLTYNAAFNIDPTTTGVAVPLTEGSYVKAASRLTPTGDTRIEAYSVLTVVPAVPLANAFRPGIRAASKVLAKTTADIDWSLRRNIPGFQPVADLTSNIGAIKRLQWTWFPGNEPSRGYFPAQGINNYGADWGDALGGRMLAFHGDYSQAQLEELVHSIVQIGIDLVAGAQDGAQWRMEEGHHIFRKFPALMAALLLDDADMKAAVNWNLLPRAFGNDDNAHYYITQQLIDASPTQNSKTNFPLPYTQDHLGMPEWGSAVETDSSDGIATPDLKASYRVLNGLRHIQGVAWVFGTPGAEALCNPAMLDYWDRMAEILAGHYEAGLYTTAPPDPFNNRPPFTGNWGSTPFGATRLATYRTMRAFSQRPTFVNIPEEMGRPALTAAGNGTITVGINEVNAFLSPRNSVSPIQSYQLRWRPVSNLTGTTVADASVPWQVITGIPSLPYTLTGVPGNTQIRVQIRAVNAEGVGIWHDDSAQLLEGSASQYVQTVTTANVNTVPQAVKAPVVQLAILGEGQTANCDPGIWAGNPSAVTLSYQWQRSTDGGGSWSNIAGATSQTYMTVSADVGNQIRCAVTGTNTTGATTANSGSRAISASPATSFSPPMLRSSFRPIWHYAAQVYQGDGFLYADIAGDVVLPGERGANRLNELGGANFDGLTDVDILMELEFGGTSRNAGQILLRGGGDNQEQGYILGYTRGTTASSTDFYIRRMDNSVETELARFDIGGAGWPVNTRMSIRAQAVGSTLRAKYWVTSASEPTTWRVETTDTTYAAGFIGWMIPQQAPVRIYRFDVTPL